MNNVVEYESDGKVNSYGSGYDINTDTTALQRRNMLSGPIIARTATEPLQTPLRAATWMDVLQPSGKPPEPSPWTPPALSQLERKALGKMGEETNEKATVLFRIHLQGLDGIVPGSTKTNRQWLEEEIADDMATSALAVKHLKLDLDFIEQRAKKKTVYLEKWYMLPDLPQDGKTPGITLLPDIDPEGHKNAT